MTDSKSRFEAFLTRWDNARAKLLAGDKSDTPRLIIEDALYDFEQACEAQSTARIAQLEGENERLLHHLGEIKYALNNFPAGDALHIIGNEVSYALTNHKGE